jgi:superfamily II DNA or RNA helicase
MASPKDDHPFPQIRFRGQLRPSQQDVVEIARRKLTAGARRLHIVAPPGSGKTVLGLYLWAECVRRPALVLSPNSAIQSQWAARTDLFDFDGRRDGIVSTDSHQPALLTSLTYQSVTLPGRGDDDQDAAALRLWQDKLIAKGQAQDPAEAVVWINDLRRHNRDYFEQRLSTYRKQVRDAKALGGAALKTLHESSLDTLHRLRDRGVGLIILDECHHLLGHWGRVLADAHELLGHPVVVGLTATPPDRDGKNDTDIERYDEYFGEIDYEVPVPAVVKDGFLAPYQDLAYFVRPTSDELSFVANADDQLHAIVEDLCQPRAVATGAGSDVQNSVLPETDPPISAPTIPAKLNSVRLTPEQPAEPLPEWLLKVLTERRLPAGVAKDWASFERRDPEFATAARALLARRGIEVPPDVPPLDMDLAPDEVPEMEILVPVLDRYVRHRLRRSENPADHQLAEQVTRRLRMLGMQITETGCQACASPVGRVMAYSQSKLAALPDILKAERQTLGDRIRAVVVADYEKTSAVTAEVSHLLDSEAGGAVAAFKALLRDPLTDELNPILVTGSSVLIDDDAAPAFDAAAQTWLRENGFQVELSFGEEDGFHVINGKGSDWCPRVYVELITELFQRGLTRCLVGTRGLLGEGWDANKVNVLIDLTTVTTSMSVNQLRGRSIRLDPGEPQKLANNWDVVCLAPEFSKGLDDYKRFIAKHQTLYGVTDDGAIEKGVGHVHPAFTELRPEGLEGSTNLLNDDMLDRVARRDEVRQRWRIGQPYSGIPIRALEARPIRERDAGGFPPFANSRDPWNPRSLALAVGAAVLGALHEAKLVQARRGVHVGERAGGYVRLFLEQASEDDNRLFTAAMHEALGPLHRPRYVIPRLVDHVHDTWISSILPRIVGRYFQRRQRRRVMLHAVPSVLAKNKDLAEIFQRHWNQHVSPGEAIYAYHGTGEELLAEARRKGQVPSSQIHEKDIFL